MHKHKCILLQFFLNLGSLLSVNMSFVYKNSLLMYRKLTCLFIYNTHSKVRHFYWSLLYNFFASTQIKLYCFSVIIFRNVFFLLLQCFNIYYYYSNLIIIVETETLQMIHDHFRGLLLSISLPVNKNTNEHEFLLTNLINSTFFND